MFSIIISVIILYNLIKRPSSNGEDDLPDGQALPGNTNTTTTNFTDTSLLAVPTYAEQVAVGSVMTSLSSKYEPCTDMWHYVCGPYFSEESRLSVRQKQINELLHEVLQSAGFQYRMYTNPVYLQRLLS